MISLKQRRDTPEKSFMQFFGNARHEPGDLIDPITAGAKRRPPVLLAFAVFTGVAILAACVVATVIVRHNVQEAGKAKVGEQAAFIARAIIPHQLVERHWSAPLEGRRLEDFDRDVKRDILGDGTSELSLYNSDGTVVYSTDPERIGQTATDPDQLATAIAGRRVTAVASRRQTTADGAATDNYQRMIESIVPVKYSQNAPATGALSIETDFNTAAGSIAKRIIPLALALLLVLLGLYLALLPMLRRTTHALTDSNDQLRRHADDLRATLSERAAIEIRLRETISELEHSENQLASSQEETIMRLSIAVESRDAETGQHIERMGKYCALLAEKLGWPDHSRELLRTASPLHDVGKIAIADSVLQKPGAFTPDERAEMELHAEIGHRILAGSESPLLDLAARIALSHHERWDGSGYPNGLVGEEIPVEGRIAAIADVFDALTSDRVYRPAMPLDKALTIMTEGRGSHFDPAILDVFFGSIEEIVAIRDGRPSSSDRPHEKARKRRTRSHARHHSPAVPGPQISDDDTRHSLVG